MRRIVVPLVLAFAFFALATVPVQAKSTATPFSATGTFAPTGPPARVWTDEDGVTHIRGGPNAGTLSGDLVGTLSFEFNANIDATGGGDLFGPFTIDSDVGTFEGRFSGTFTGGVASGDFVGQGADGSKIMGTFTGPSPGLLELDGVILQPQG